MKEQLLSPLPPPPNLHTVPPRNHHLNLIKALLVPERNGHELGIGMLSSVFRGCDVVLAQPEVGFPVKDFPVGRPLLWLLGEHFTQLCHAIF